MAIDDDSPLLGDEEDSVALSDFFVSVIDPFLAARERIEQVWDGELTVDSATLLVNEALVNLGVMVSVIEMGGDDWNDPVDGFDPPVSWIDGFVSRLLTIAAAAAIGSRLTAPPEMTEETSIFFSFALVGNMLAHARSDDPVRLHLAVLNAAGKLMRHQRLLDAARRDDEDAIAELDEMSETDADATRALSLVFTVVAGAALAAAYRLRPLAPAYIEALDEHLARPHERLP